MRKFNYYLIILLLQVLFLGCEKSLLHTSEESRVEISDSISELNQLDFDSSEVQYDNWPITRTTNDRSKFQDGDFLTPNYVPIGTVWNHRIITYFFQNGTDDIAGDGEQQAVRDAFQIWAAETDLIFLEVCNANEANIVIMWGTFGHGDPFPPCFGGATDFDGPNGVLGHALGGPPNNSCGNLAGDFHLDDSETWTLNLRNDAQQPIDLVTIAAHEIGHSLGLHHTSVSGSLMLAAYTGSHRFLGNDDRLGIQSLYGPSTGNNIISGTTNLCSSETYTINGLPSGATVTWTVSDPNAVSMSVNGNTLTLTRNGNSNVQINLIATISNQCGSISVEKVVYVGIPQILTGVYFLAPDGGPGLCIDYRGNEIGFNVTNYEGSYTIEVEVLNSSNQVIYSFSYTGAGPWTFNFLPPFAATYAFRTRVSHACGYSDWLTGTVNCRRCDVPGGRD